MNRKIVSIKEKVPQAATLPDGFYSGLWGGYVIEVRHKEKMYELQTDDGVKGMGIKVVVEVKDGVATFDELKN